MMIRYNTIESIPFAAGTALTIGTFDGVHLGHRSIIRELLNVARGSGERSVVLTFDPHPQQVLRRTGEGVPILTPIERKGELLEELGIDILGVIPFNREFAATPWREFVDRLVDQIGLAHMVVGHDHAFGKGREGNAERLREYGAERGFTFTQIGPLLVDGSPISSTRIRKAVASGYVETGARLLGRPYRLSGRIVRGDQRGRELGFPTANLEPFDPDQLVPGSGVYATRMVIPGESEGGPRGLVPGMTNIGLRPTFTDGSRQTIETHLFDFSDELYDRTVSIEFVKLLRFEKKFDSKESFLEQLGRDREEARSALDL